MIERKIIIGLITNTRYLRQIKEDWNNEYLESSTAQTLANWCWEYFSKYKKAPMQEIETIFIKKLKKGMDKDLAEEIEEDILPGLSKEYEKKKTNTKHLIDETHYYFIERQINIHKENIDTLIAKGKYDEAEKLIDNFKLNKFEEAASLDLSDIKTLDKVDEAFEKNQENLIEFPGALGQFWNDQLIRGGFVGILAPEKRGKTFWLLEFMMRAISQGRKVTFFQAGDMTELQQIMRIAIYLARKSNKEKYCGTRYIPVYDCIFNQMDMCGRKIRESNFGVFSGKDEKTIREEVGLPDLIEAYRDYPKYKNCYNCMDWWNNKWGVPWIKPIDIKYPLSSYEAKKLWKKFFIDNRKNVRLSTHANGTLTVEQSIAILERQERQGFKSDIVLYDYVDIMTTVGGIEFRHKENEKWKGLRRVSQEKDCLVIAPTQADALSYEQDTLKLKNFSEDKRKYGHVTAMFGLNWDTKGREKKLGIMRINGLTMREDDFEVSDCVKVLQRLEMGRPFLGSYY